MISHKIYLSKTLIVWDFFFSLSPCNGLQLAQIFIKIFWWLKWIFIVLVEYHFNAFKYIPHMFNQISILFSIIQNHNLQNVCISCVFATAKLYFFWQHETNKTFALHFVVLEQNRFLSLLRIEIETYEIDKIHLNTLSCYDKHNIYCIVTVRTRLEVLKFKKIASSCKWTIYHVLFKMPWLNHPVALFRDIYPVI